MKNKKLRIAIPILAAVLALGIAVSPARAYFTASDFASGSQTVSWPTTHPEERYLNGQKIVRIGNNDESVPVYIRARISWATSLGYVDDPSVTVTPTDGWTKIESASGDGYEWWEYGPVVAPGEYTSDLTATITWPFKPDEVVGGKASASGEGGQDSGETVVTLTKAQGANFNIVIVYEAEPVLYNEAGEALPASWTY